MKKLFFLFLLIPSILFAQSDTVKGIRFEQGLSWKQIQEKAKAENKYIFIDCFTTWCGPCRRMDADVYSSDSVGDYFNAHFISIKLQMDKTKKDDEWVKSMYADADVLGKKYKILAYPSYLFFSPEGQIVHKDLGFKEIHDFMKVGLIATAPGKIYENPYAEYDSLIEAYMEGNKQYSKMPYLITTAIKLHDQEVAASLTLDYCNYLLRLKEEQLYTKENISFMISDLQTFKSKFFRLFYPDGKKIDAVMNKKGYAQAAVDNLIQREYAYPILIAAKGREEPDWSKLSKTIKEKYNANYIERNIVAAKVEWYRRKTAGADYNKYYPTYIKYFIQQVEKNWQDTTEMKTDLILNDVAYDKIFNYSTDKGQINVAIKWMEGVLRRNIWTPPSPPMDTYANLLYKAGRKEEAIQWEEKALRIATEAKDKSDIEEFQKTLSKMKNGEPTWRVKPIIDSSAISNWVSLGTELAISNDGKYFSYILNNKPVSSSTLIIQSTDNSWKKEFPGASNCFFSGDNKQVVFKAGDTLYFLKTGANDPNYIIGVGSYKKPKAGKGEWLAYQLKNESKDLVLYNFFKEKEQRFSSVIDYSFDENGNILIMKSISIKDNNSTNNLKWVSLKNDKPVTIWSDKSSSISGYSFDKEGTQLVFVVKEKKADQAFNTIWYYKEGMDRAVIKVNSQVEGIESGLYLGGGAPQFSKDGRYFFFRLQQGDLPKPNPNAVKLDVWSYTDTILQSMQLQDLGPKIYTAVMSTEGNKMIRLTKDYEGIRAYQEDGNFVVVGCDSKGDRFWLKEQDKNWLVSLRDGSRILLKAFGKCEFSFSPDGHYLVYNDAGQENNYFSYDLMTGKSVNISKTIPYPWLVYENNYDVNIPPATIGIAGWQNGGSGLLVYDNYDIWQLDPEGKRPPLNITNEYGRLHNIKFRLISKFQEMRVFPDNALLLLTAFNTVNKFNGFYQKRLDGKGDPELLTMGPYTYYLSLRKMLPPNSNDFDLGMPPLKAGDVETWIVKRQSNNEAPNYFLTTDFKNYTPLTRLQPQKGYNWLTADLVSWKQFDGTISQGILYKPENFDPNKKYPLLFNYYEALSHRLYEYPMPDFTESNINIPWFVSHGYLVFTPDIYDIKRGKPGQSAYNSVVSAAQWLSKLSFVDGKKMGINGHSWGGYKTNYLVTHTNLFAAAIEGAGTSNFISSSLQLAGDNGDKESRMAYYEPIMGASIWQRPDLYMENSPVLHANEVTTPLIIFHSKGDPAVPWAQAVEMFVSLRRLGKPSWILQYDGQPHGNSGEAAVDFTKRITQFFDHYLKGAPAPKWMLDGIPAKMKGIDDGLQLVKEKDKNGNWITPGPGLLINAPKKVKQ